MTGHIFITPKEHSSEAFELYLSVPKSVGYAVQESRYVWVPIQVQVQVQVQVKVGSRVCPPK